MRVSGCAAVVNRCLPFASVVARRTFASRETAATAREDAASPLSSLRPERSRFRSRRDADFSSLLWSPETDTFRRVVSAGELLPRTAIAAYRALPGHSNPPASADTAGRRSGFRRKGFECTDCDSAETASLCNRHGMNAGHGPRRQLRQHLLPENVQPHIVELDRRHFLPHPRRNLCQSVDSTCTPALSVRPEIVAHTARFSDLNAKMCGRTRRERRADCRSSPYR